MTFGPSQWCDCAVPMLRGGWLILVVGVAVVGSVLAAVVSRRRAAGHGNDGANIAAPLEQIHGGDERSGGAGVVDAAALSGAAAPARNRRCDEVPPVAGGGRTKA